MKTILKSPKQINKALPVERRAWIGLATRGDIAMTGDPIARQFRVGIQQSSANSGQCLVLRIGIGRLISPLQLNTDGEVIAGFAPLETGLARMPGPTIKRHKLSHLAVTLNQQVRGNFQRLDLFKERVPVWIQTISKELGNMTTTELPGWQTDIVNHQQRNLASWTLVAVGRCDVSRALDTVVNDGKARLVQRVYSDSILRLPYFR